MLKTARDPSPVGEDLSDLEEVAACRLGFRVVRSRLVLDEEKLLIDYLDKSGDNNLIAAW